MLRRWESQTLIKVNYREKTSVNNRVNHSDEGLKLKTPVFESFTVANFLNDLAVGNLLWFEQPVSNIGGESHPNSSLRQDSITNSVT